MRAGDRGNRKIPRFQQSIKGCPAHTDIFRGIDRPQRFGFHRRRLIGAVRSRWQVKNVSKRLLTPRPTRAYATCEIITNRKIYLMARLVNAMREGIIDRLMTHTFNERIEALHATHAAAAMAAYVDIYDAPTRKRMDDLPDGWLATDNDIRIEASASTIVLEFSGNFPYYGKHASLHVVGAMAHYMRFPVRDKGRTLKVYDGGTPIAERVTEFMERRDALMSEMQLARKRAAATLDTVHTLEKLIEQWPEIEPFIDEKDRPVPVTALTIPTDQLNELFKLPAVAA